MATNEYDIVIAGAGIAGTALACLLADTGLRIALVDAGPVPIAEPEAAFNYGTIDARVLALTAASKTVLEAAGVWSQVQAKGVSAYTAMQVWDAEGTGTLDFDCAEVDAPALGWIVENRVLVWALQQRVVQSNVSVFAQQPVAAIGYEQDVAKVDLADGTCLRAPLLVGADGANSMVREATGVQVHSIDNRQQAIVCHIETQGLHDAVARQRFLATGPLALLPVGAVAPNVSSIVWSCDNAYAKSLLALDDATFCEQLTRASEGVLGAVQGATKRLSFPLIARHAQAYIAPNTALIGDAAHVVHPLAGQGINLGLSDVAALGALLQTAAAKALPVNRHKLLAAYQRQRRGDNVRMIALTQSLRHLFARDALAIRWLRNQGMNTINSQPAIKRAIIKQAMGI